MKILYLIPVILLVMVLCSRSYLLRLDSNEIKNNGQQESIIKETSSYIIGDHQSLLTENGEIDIVDSNYMIALTEIFYNLEKYQGKKVTLEGFVHREDDYDDNQFMLTRLVSSCCEEHAVFMGLLSYWEDVVELKQDTWISVKGTLQSTLHYSPDIDKEATWPMVIVEELEIIEKPEEEYIYHE